MPFRLKVPLVIPSSESLVEDTIPRPKLSLLAKSLVLSVAATIVPAGPTSLTRPSTDSDAVTPALAELILSITVERVSEVELIVTVFSEDPLTVKVPAAMSKADMVWLL